MKKIELYLAALGLLFVTSCAQESVETLNNGSLSFKTYLGKQTKASEFKATNFKNLDEVPIYAYKSSDFNSNYFGDAAKLTFDGTNWTLTGASGTTQPGYELTYYAWYPITNAPRTAYSKPEQGTSDAFLSYTVQTTDLLQEDLLAARVATTASSVGINFKHTLSQVNFAVQGLNNIKIKIENISVNGVKSKGSYAFLTNLWAAQSDPANYVYNPIANETLGTNTDIFYLGNGGTDFSKSNALILMPQAFNAQGDGNFTFDFTLTDANTNKVLDTKTGVRANFVDFQLTTWEPGKRYLYLIDFTNYFAGQPLTFSVTVEDWVNSDPVYIATSVEIANPTSLKASLENAIKGHATRKADVTNGGDKLTIFPISIATSTTVGATELSATVLDGTTFKAGDRIIITSQNDVTLTLESGSTKWALTSAGAQRYTLTRIAD